MILYCLIDNGVEMPRWCELGADEAGNPAWIDFRGKTLAYEFGKMIGHTSGMSLNEAMSKISEETADLERRFAYRFLLDPWSDQGWIAPDGKFYGCKYFGHDQIANAMLRRNEYGLERDGWVRVHDDSYRYGDVRELTKRQLATLEKLGFVENARGGHDRMRGFHIDRSQPAPRYAVKIPEGMVLPGLEPRARTEDEMREIDLSKFIVRMREHEVLARLLEMSHETIPDVGPGTWDWMIRWDGLDIGSEETPGELLRAEGFHLTKTSFDTIEIAGWPRPGLHYGDREAELVAKLMVGLSDAHDRAIEAALPAPGRAP